MMREMFDLHNYVFNHISVPVFLVSVAIFCLGIFAFIREPSSRLSLSFLVMNLSISIWLFSFSWMYCAADERIGFLWATAGYTGVFFIPPSIYHFSVLMLQVYQKYKRRIWAAWIISGILFITIIVPHKLIAGVYDYWWGYYPKNDPPAILFLIFFFAIMIEIMRCFRVEYRHMKKNTMQQRRARAFVTGICIAYIGSFDFIAAYGIPLYPFGYLPVFVLVLISWRVILRYRLVDITSAFAADQIIATMNDCLVVCDAGNEIRVVNESLCSMLGYRQRELIGRSVELIFDVSAAETEKFQALLKQGAVREEEMVFRSKMNGRIDVSISLSRLQDRDSFNVCMVMIARDIRERKRVEGKLKAFAGKLEQSNQELRNINFIAAHHLQEPLRKIRTFCDRLKSAFAGSLAAEARDYIERMQRTSAKMQDLVDGLYKYSRVTGIANPFEQVALDEVVKNVITSLHPLIEQTGGKLETGSMATIDADPFQMRHLMHQLITNALKFHKRNEPPVVKITGRLIQSNGELPGNNRADKKIYEVTIEDNGIGFDEKYSGQIFRIFQRLHGHNEYEGTGIGLSICRKIVERHGGSISAKSMSGEGAVFTVTLPVIQDGEAVST